MTIETQLNAARFDTDLRSGTAIGTTFFISDEAEKVRKDIKEQDYNNNCHNVNEFLGHNELVAQHSTNTLSEIALTQATLRYHELRIQGYDSVKSESIVSNEIHRAKELSEMPEFKGIVDVIYMKMTRDAEEYTEEGYIPGLLLENGELATKEELATDMMYVLLMELRKAQEDNTTHFNHEALLALDSETNINDARDCIRTILNSAGESESYYAPGDFPLVVEPNEENAFLILSRAAAKAYCGYGTTLENNANLTYRILAGQDFTELTYNSVSAEVHKALLEPPKIIMNDIEEENPELNIWVRRLAKLSVIASGLFIWKEATKANETMMEGVHAGCAVNTMVAAEKVTFYLSSFLYTYRLINSTFRNIEEATTYTELLKETAFIPSVAVLTAVGKAIGTITADN